MKEILLFITGNKYFGLELPMVRSIHRPSLAMMKYGDEGASYVSETGDDIPLCDFSMVIGEKNPPELIETKKLMFITARNRTMARDGGQNRAGGAGAIRSDQTSAANIRCKSSGMVSESILVRRSSRADAQSRSGICRQDTGYRRSG
ncbi:MAG: hypothetical protein HC887_12370 [Desulfobacteraceae bacterium]|nr:hypothetical protein [Desulfobacteraceae bacterium]